jgi:hypothetical protein
MPETRALNRTQQKALDTFVTTQERFKAAWAAQRELSKHRLTALARCRDLGIPGETTAAASSLSPGRIHQLYMELDGHKREHWHPKTNGDDERDEPES